MRILLHMKKAAISLLAIPLALILAIPLTAASHTNGDSESGGNSAVAHLCHQGGWQNVAPEGNPGASFSRTGDCVSYGAQGGTIVELLERNEAKIACEDFNRTYTEGNGTDYLWTCAKDKPKDNKKLKRLLTSICDETLFAALTWDRTRGYVCA